LPLCERLAEIEFNRCRINLQLIQRRRGLLRAAARRSHRLRRDLNRLSRGLRVTLVLLLYLHGLLQVGVVSSANLLLVALHVLQNLGLQGPSKKVQLSNRGHETLMIGNRKHDPLSATIWVKVLLGIGFELPLVAKIDEELLAIQRVAHEALSAVFGDKPVNDAKAQGRLAIQIAKHFLNFRMMGIKSLETGDDEFGLALDLTLSGLRVGGVIHVCLVDQTRVLGPLFAMWEFKIKRGG